jgi:GNAT superfamily N-acetyltransferase
MPRMATADPVGQRVVIRRVVDGGGGKLSDVVGVLVEAGPDVLVLRRRDGSLVELSRSAVTVMKSVPAAPRDVLALEEVAALGWQAPQTRWLGRWLLRAAEGWTGRANSVLPLGEPGLPLDAALAEVTAWYAERGLPGRFALPTPAREALGTALVERGWSSYNPTSVLTADVGVTLDRLPPAHPGAVVQPEPTADWLALYHYRGSNQLPPVARAVLTGARSPGFALIGDTAGQVLAIARGSVDEGWVGVTAVEVDQAHRRQGLGAAVLRVVLEWGRAQGALSTYLQVADDNTAALALYRKYGYTRHHGYRYVQAPAQPSSAGRRSPER